MNYIQGVAKVPPGFGAVKSASFRPGEVTFVGEGGQSVVVAVQHEYLKTGALR